MLEITVECAMCGKQMAEPIDVSLDHRLNKTYIISAIRDRKWIVQENGHNIDCYCCKKCAE